MAASRLNKIPRLVDKKFRVFLLSLFDAKWANKGNANNFKEFILKKPLLCHMRVDFVQRHKHILSKQQ